LFHSSEVAKGLKQEAYGLVFGINTFMALAFQTILTLIVADNVGLALEPQDQVLSGVTSSKA
jgi:solute carrier family 19 (thiamine transporter), member 2/3